MTPDSDDTDGEPPRIPGSKKGMIMFRDTGVLQNLRSTFTDEPCWTEACGFEEPDFGQKMTVQFVALKFQHCRSWFNDCNETSGRSLRRSCCFMMLHMHLNDSSHVLS